MASPTQSSDHAGAAFDAVNQNSTPKAGQKRKRNSIARGAQSPDSESHPSDRPESQHDLQPRHTATKRACNECRQQKLRCDIVTEPHHVDCSRCRRLKLECRIDANFKRIGKRSRNAAMEREIQELRAQLQTRGGVLPFSTTHDLTASGSHMSSLTTAEILAQQPDPLTALHQGAVGSLIDLKNSSGHLMSPRERPVRVLGNTRLTSLTIDDLYARYFEHYHPHIPVLDPTKSPDYYYDCSPLLFWSVIAVASRRYTEDPTLLTGVAAPLSTLLWTTIAQVPQNYHVVKALCLLCTWPLPTKSTSTDPTFILSGIMMQVALQTGLHRPSHVQDFSRIRVDLREDDIGDRLRAWAGCNIVCQSVSTGTGQPPKTIYDHTLTHVLEPNNELPSDIYWRLQIERFCNKVSQKLYNNRDHPIGISSDTERAAWISLLVGEFNRLKREITKHDSLVEELYLHAAGLHLRLAAFFDSPTAPNYANDLLELYFATSTFLTTALELTTLTKTTPAVSPEASHSNSHPNGANGTSAHHHSPNSSSPKPNGPASLATTGNTKITSLAALKHVSNYIMQMLLAGGFTLMKLLNSFFAQHIDADSARRLFNNTIRAIRAISVSNNDLPGRLAEVLAQLWRSSGAGFRPTSTSTPPAPINGTKSSSGGTSTPNLESVAHIPVDNSLQLKVRCRMSMSLLFDSVWRWREEHIYKSGVEHTSALANLDQAVNNPTDPEAPPPPQTQQPQQQQQQQQATQPQRPPPALPPGFAPSAHLLGLAPNDPTLTTNASSDDGAQQIDALAGLGAASDVGYEVFDPLTWMLDGDLGDYGMDDAALSGGGISGVGLDGVRDPWS